MLDIGTATAYSDEPRLTARPTSAKSARHASLACLVAIIQVCGCMATSRNSGPSPQSPERQSETEYDVARDYFFKGDRRSALDHAVKAVEFDDSNSNALYFTSAIFLSFCSDNETLEGTDCRISEAESYARRALKSEPSFRDARNLLGQILILENKLPEALTMLEPLTRDIGYTQIHLAWGNYGWAQVLSGDLNGGIASLRNSLAEARFCVGHYRLGVAYEKRGDLAEAEASLSQAVTVESPDCQSMQAAWEARARVRAKSGRTADARGDYTRCRDIAPESPLGKSCHGMLSGPRAAVRAKAPDGVHQ